MNSLLCITGIVVLLVVSVDAFITVLSLRGSGPVTYLWTRALWKLLLKIHGTFSIHRVLSITGPLMLIGTVLVWYFLMCLGWLCLFSSVDGAVINSKTMQEAGGAELFYFLSSTLSTVGYGDFVPTAFPWTFFATLSAMMATLLITMSLSYIVSVVSAALERIDLAEETFALGDTPEEMLETLWEETDNGLGNPHLLKLLSLANSNVHKQFSYPILRYFHQSSKSKSNSLAMLNLSDTVFIATHGLLEENRPSRGLKKVAWNFLRNYTTVAHGTSSSGTPGEESHTLDYDRLLQLDRPVVDHQTFEAAMQQYLPLRAQLIQLCVDDGWRREVIA